MANVTLRASPTSVSVGEHVVVFAETIKTSAYSLNQTLYKIIHNPFNMHVIHPR